MRCINNSKRLLLITAACFTLNLFAPYCDARTIHIQPKTVETKAQGRDEVIIPAGLGYVDDRYSGPSGKTVFHIKDAHCNYDAQKAIYSLIDLIVKKEGVEIIGLEGGSGSYDLSLLENTEEVSIKDALTERYLREGRLNGAEFYRVYNPSKARLTGIEDPDLYEQSLLAYRSILSYRPQVESFLSGSASILAALAEQNFSEDLKTFEANRELFSSNKMELGAYISYLYRAASARSVAAKDLLNMIAMSKLLLAERGIDFNEANKERERLVSLLFERLSRIERAQFLSRAGLFETGRIDNPDFTGIFSKNPARLGSKTAPFRTSQGIRNTLRYTTGLMSRGFLEK